MMLFQGALLTQAFVSPVLQIHQRTFNLQASPYSSVAQATRSNKNSRLLVNKTVMVTVDVKSEVCWFVGNVR